MSESNDIIAARLALLSKRDLRQLTSEMAWTYRRRRIDAPYTLTHHILTHVGKELPSEVDWAAIRKLVIALRTKARIQAKAEKAERQRIKRQRYMRVYMKDYRQKRALAVLKGSTT